MSDLPRLDGVVVLVVEDNSNSQDLLRQLLESRGASVVTAGTGSEALRIVETNPPDVLLSDIEMPVMNGYMLMEKLRQKRIDVPAAAVTAFTGPQARIKRITAGFRYHIAKPFDVADLLKKVAILAGGVGIQA